jgi:putative PIN family toxin of toxin-antitoxin system
MSEFQLLKSDTSARIGCQRGFRQWVARPKFRGYATESEALAFVAVLRARAIVVEDPNHVERVTRDPADDYLLALALTAEASAIVSCDADLTELASAPVTRPDTARLPRRARS